MKEEHIVGALIALGAALALGGTYQLGKIQGRDETYNVCARDGFVWYYGERWDCRKTVATPK